MPDLKYDLKHTEDRMLEWKKAHWMQIGEDVNYSTDKLQAIWFLENEKARVLYNMEDDVTNKE